MMKNQDLESAFTFLQTLALCYQSEEPRQLPDEPEVLAFYKRLKLHAIAILNEAGENKTVKYLVIQELLSTAVRYSDAFYELINKAGENFVVLPLQQEQTLLNLLLNVLNGFVHWLKDHLNGVVREQLNSSFAYRQYIYQLHKTERLALEEILGVKSVDKELQKLLKNYLESIVKSPVASISLEALAYYSFFIKNSALEEFSKKADRNLNDLLWNTLLVLNFNHPDFIAYSQQHYFKINQRNFTIEAKKSHVLLLLKEVQSIPKFTGPNLRADFPGLRLLFKKRLKEEYKALSQLVRTKRDAGLVSATPLQRDEILLKVNFTLHQLLFFFKVMMECNLLELMKGQSIFNFIHRFIRTKRQEQLSIGSMKRKHSGVTERDIKRVRMMLNMMLNHIDHKNNIR